MLERHLVWLGATNVGKSKRRGDKAAIVPQANKERNFIFHMLEKNSYIVFQIYVLRQGFRLSLVLDFPQISCSCSYKKECIEKKKLN